MKYCTKCGKEVHDEAVICIHCGCQIEGTQISKNPEDAPNTAFAILGFFMPVVGLILYLVNMDTAPLRAKSAGQGALIGVCVSVALSVLIGSMIASVS